MARAARLTSGIGAAAGGLSAAQWFAPASLLALPLELGAETVLIGAVEVVLVGELHELHGRPATGRRPHPRGGLPGQLVRPALGGRGRRSRARLAARRRGAAGAAPPP